MQNLESKKSCESLFSSNEIKLKNQKIGKILCINIFRAVKIGLERHFYVIIPNITAHSMQTVN